MGKLCLAKDCGKLIAGDWPGDYHVGCYPPFETMPGFDMTSYDLEVKEDLTQIVINAQKNAARSKQVALGVSEVGNECDLRIAYKMAGIPPTSNSPDPWPSIVGTAVHSWLQKAVEDYEHLHGTNQWLAELDVVPSPLVQGHTDLYDRHRSLVLDFKIPSPDNLKKMRMEGVPEQYVIQVQLYGLGHVNAGRKVERVGIVGLGRQGWLKDMYVWTTPFDREVAERALQRVYDIGSKMIELNLPDSERWDLVERTSSRLCAWCPWFEPTAPGPWSNGCPGHKR